MSAIELVLGPLLIGLQIEWWPILDEALRGKYPNAVGIGEAAGGVAGVQGRATCCRASAPHLSPR